MNDDKDEKGNLLEDAKRLTFVGNIVRKTSLDELPPPGVDTPEDLEKVQNPIVCHKILTIAVNASEKVNNLLSYKKPLKNY